MDRMLATDEEIQAMRGAAGLDQEVFRSPEEAGMTAEEYEAFLDAKLVATARSARAASLRIMKDRLRERFQVSLA